MPSRLETKTANRQPPSPTVVPTATHTPQRSPHQANERLRPATSLPNNQRLEPRIARDRQLNRPRRSTRRHRHLHPQLLIRLQRKRTLRPVRNKEVRRFRERGSIAGLLSPLLEFLR